MKRRIDLIFVVFFVSGFAGLIYQSIWSHYAKLFLGHAAYAQTLVLVVFIGGLAAGAWLCSRFAERVRNPLRVYAMVELAIGLMALVSHRVFVATIDWSFASLLPTACGQATAFCPAQWVVTAALLTPQSILLGATFPLVCSAVLRIHAKQSGHDISTLYFVNSFGAVLGVLASAFVLIPAVGLPGTLRTAGLLNVALALAAWVMSRVAPPALAVEPMPARAAAADADGKRFVRVLIATAFLTGLSSFIYEIAWIRMLSLVLGASTHSFELMLASFILGIALGGLWIRNRLDRIDDPVRFLALVQLAMGAAAAATIPLYIGSFDFMAWLIAAVSRTEGGYVLFSLTGTLIALVVMLPATFCAGMTLPLITYRLLHSREGERALGKVYAVNTLGGIAGVIVAVHLLLPVLGLHFALMVGAAIDIGLGVFVLAYATRPDIFRAALRGPIPAALAALAIIAFAFQIDPRTSASGVFRTGAARMAPNVVVPFHRDGKTATVTVVQNDNLKAIRTNGKTDASLSMDPKGSPTGDEYTMMLLGVLPLGHRPDAKMAAVIGFGSGMSTTMLLASPHLQRVDTVEIEPAMVEGARFFQPLVDPSFKDPRSHIVIDDAKSYFARGRERYDIIVSEPSNPWVSGVASLFTEEFYARLSGYLNEGGVLSQWLHTYEMDSATLAAIIKAVSKTFPDYAIYASTDSDIVLIARKGGAAGNFDPSVLQYPGLRVALERLKMTDGEVVQRRRVGTAGVVSALFSDIIATANSDYYPVVEQRTSKTRFTQARVSELVEFSASAVPMQQLLDGEAEPSTRRYQVELVTAYEIAVSEAWRIRDAIVGGGRDSGPVVTPKELTGQLVAQWAKTCPGDLTFDNVQAALVTVAESTAPYLPPSATAEMWRHVLESPCARRITAPQRQWLQLFDATARRDVRAMVSLGEPILAGTRGAHNAASEYAFLATVSALVCQGHKALANAYLNELREWMRPQVRSSELTTLRGMALSPAKPTCAVTAG